MAGTEGDLLEEAKDFFGREEGVLWEEGLTLVFGKPHGVQISKIKGKKMKVEENKRIMQNSF